MRKHAIVLAALALATLVPWVPAGAVPAHKLRCFGLEANVIGTPGNDVFPHDGWVEPDDQPFVIVGLGGNDTVDFGRPDSGSPDVLFCGGTGRDTASGVDRFNGGRGKDTAIVYCGMGRKSVERVIYQDCPQDLP